MIRIYIQLFLILLFPSLLRSQPACCQVPACHDKAMELKNTILPLLAFGGKATPNHDLEMLSAFKKSAIGQMKIFYVCPDKELNPDLPTGLRFDQFRMRGWIEEGNMRMKQVLSEHPDGNLDLVAWSSFRVPNQDDLILGDVINRFSHVRPLGPCNQPAYSRYDDLWRTALGLIR